MAVDWENDPNGVFGQLAYNPTYYPDRINDRGTIITMPLELFRERLNACPRERDHLQVNQVSLHKTQESGWGHEFILISLIPPGNSQIEDSFYLRVDRYGGEELAQGRSGPAGASLGLGTKEAKDMVMITRAGNHQSSEFLTKSPGAVSPGNKQHYDSSADSVVSLLGSDRYTCGAMHSSP